ncbi:thermonuclease family protein [Croceimicrobium sp.]|uniref:thermonuclease family protein n=1 Tax=Croceimicrobium sp. TaxID=2828340 RepID=UPI003BAD5F62
MDIIQGRVFRVIDGDTFDIDVTNIGKKNKFNYHAEERIRFSSINAPEIDTGQGQLDKILLEEILLDKMVEISIQARDTYNRIVGEVKLI